MPTARGIGVAVTGLLLVAIPGLAHHSFKAEYDPSHLITLKGTVTKVNWQNPHVLVFLDVKGDTGKVTNWELELASPNLLLSQGWTLSSIRTGDAVTVEGYPARGGAKIANARKVTVDPR